MKNHSANESKLDDLAKSLPEVRAEFDTEDLVLRAEQVAKPNRRVLNWSAAAAAVLLLAVTHAAAFLFGVDRAAPESTLDAIGQSEAILREIVALDATAPYERLEKRLVHLREELEEPELMIGLASATPQPRAALLADQIGQLLIAYGEVKDPAFRAVTIGRIATQALEGRIEFMMVPASAQNYQRVTALGNGRFRIMSLATRDGRPTVLQDEGTVVELEQRNHGLKIEVIGEER